VLNLDAEIAKKKTQSTQSCINGNIIAAYRGDSCTVDQESSCKRRKNLGSGVHQKRCSNNTGCLGA